VDLKRIMKARHAWNYRGRCKAGCLDDSRGALPLTPGFSEAWLWCPMVVEKTKASDEVQSPEAPMHHRRTVGLVIPRQVASPQSLTPFCQARPV